MKWLKLWDKTVFGKGQDKKSKPKPEQVKKQKLNSAKNFKKQQTRGVQDEADWNVSIIVIITLSQGVVFVKKDTMCKLDGL